MSLLWRVDHGGMFHLRLLHLSDSAVCFSILSKGRTSSKPLQHVLRRINGLLFLCYSALLGVHVDSEENPTDHASRC